MRHYDKIRDDLENILATETFLDTLHGGYDNPTKGEKFLRTLNRAITNMPAYSY